MIMDALVEFKVAYADAIIAVIELIESVGDPALRERANDHVAGSWKSAEAPTDG